MFGCLGLKKLLLMNNQEEELAWRLQIIEGVGQLPDC